MLWETLYMLSQRARTLNLCILVTDSRLSWNGFLNRCQWKHLKIRPWYANDSTESDVVNDNLLRVLHRSRQAVITIRLTAGRSASRSSNVKLLVIIFSTPNVVSFKTIRCKRQSKQSMAVTKQWPCMRFPRCGLFCWNNSKTCKCFKCIDENKTIILQEGGEPGTIQYQFVISPLTLCQRQRRRFPTINGPCRVFMDYIPDNSLPPVYVAYCIKQFHLFHFSFIDSLLCHL